MQRTRKMSRNNKTSIFSRFNADKKKTLVMPTRSCLTFDPRFTETSCLFPPSKADNVGEVGEVGNGWGVQIKCRRFNFPTLLDDF